MKKILISTSIIFLSLLINSSYGASKLNEKFSIDKLIGYQARIIIQSEQDQKARNLTPKEKNDIKNKEQSEILNWKTTLENRLGWKDENYQQKLDFYIEQEFNNTPYLKNKTFLSSEEKEMVLENAYFGVHHNMQINVTKLRTQDSINSVQAQLKDSQERNMLICQTGYEKFKDKLDNKWKCKKGQLLKNQEASYEKEKEEGIKKYQVIKDFYKISDTKSIICIEEIEKSNQSEQFNYFVFSEKESAGYRFRVDTNRRRISSLVNQWEKNEMKKIPYQISFKVKPIKFSVKKHQDNDFLIFSYETFSKANNAKVLHHHIHDKINLTNFGYYKIDKPGNTPGKKPNETCKSIENKIITDEQIYQKIFTELEIKEKSVVRRKPDMRKRIVNNNQRSNIQFSNREKPIFNGEKKEESKKFEKEYNKIVNQNSQTPGPKINQQIKNNNQIKEKTNNNQIANKTNNLKKEDQKIDDKQNKNINNKPTELINKAIKDIINIPTKLLGRPKLTSEELKLFIINNKIILQENNSLRTYIFDKGFTFKVLEKNGKLIEKGKWRYTGLLSKNKIILEGKTKRYFQVFKDMKSILEKKSADTQEKGIVKKIHDFTPL